MKRRKLLNGDSEKTGEDQWEDYYKLNYSKHIEEITRLQMLLDREERQLFELIQVKKQIVNGFVE